MTYNRSQIMKEANRLTRQGIPRSEAMKAAWASAKAANSITGSIFAIHEQRTACQPSGLRAGPIIDPLPPLPPPQQQAGLRAALKRYGLDPDKIALRAQEAVKAIVAAIAQDRPALLPPPVEGAIDLTRGEDGVYRL